MPVTRCCAGKRASAWVLDWATRVMRMADPATAFGDRNQPNHAALTTATGSVRSLAS